MDGQESVSGLVAEYRTMFANRDTQDVDLLEELLEKEGDWTANSPEHLLTLARDYGSFMLRNALAISLVLEIEDGELGF